jgi:spermidine/putrescine transport system substrate-binding protein
VDNPLIFPDDDFLAATYAFMGLDSQTEQKYLQMFSDVIGA